MVIIIFCDRLSSRCYILDTENNLIEIKKKILRILSQKMSGLFLKKNLIIFSEKIEENFFITICKSISYYEASHLVLQEINLIEIMLRSFILLSYPLYLFVICIKNKRTSILEVRPFILKEI